jgi:Raf kinase inhibitor-like YbhB/YbcL family protein
MRMVRLTAAVAIALMAAGVHAAPQAQAGGGQRGAGGGRGAGAPAGAQGGAAPMRLMSNAFIDGGLIPLKYTQAAEQVSPQLGWANAPMGTQSFVLHMHDMEGARNKTSEDQLHWLVWNIAGETRALPEGVPMGDLKDGSHQTSATGNGVYRGPGAPANGPYHHYVFELFALDTKIDVPANPTDPFDTRAKVLAAIQGHVLGKAVYLGFFRRPSS